MILEFPPEEVLARPPEGNLIEVPAQTRRRRAFTPEGANADPSHRHDRLGRGVMADEGGTVTADRSLRAADTGIEGADSEIALTGLVKILPTRSGGHLRDVER